jgi:hypothetical protein
LKDLLPRSTPFNVYFAVNTLSRTHIDKKLTKKEKDESARKEKEERARKEREDKAREKEEREERARKEKEDKVREKAKEKEDKAKKEKDDKTKKKKEKDAGGSKSPRPAAKSKDSPHGVWALTRPSENTHFLTPHHRQQVPPQLGRSGICLPPV